MGDVAAGPTTSADWRLNDAPAAPAGPRAKAAANLDALQVLAELRAEHRPATRSDQERLARWSSWGALSKIFDDADVEWADDRTRLRGLLDPDAWSAARRTTLNAHYTDPRVVTGIWKALQGLGFTGGRVLEPGCGSGNFIGAAPPLPIDWVGVELDPTSAAICAQLYPSASILAQGFETTDLSDASFDAAVGNVPFGSVALHDRRHNPTGESIHNHFLIKALHLCRPGGLVAVITSRYTLDARNPQARATMSELADFVTAIRLPGATHRHVAGTEVVTDLVVLRRRSPGEPANDAGAWRSTATLDTADGPVAVNQWFVDHPELILGETRLGGAYRADDLRVLGRFDPSRFVSVLDAEVAGAVERGHRHAPEVPDVDKATMAAEPTALPLSGPGRPGSIVVLEDGDFAKATPQGVENYPVPASMRRELTDLCGIRDVVVELLAVQAATTRDERLVELQADLSARYDIYTARYGPLNRFSWARTGRSDPQTGEEIMRRLRPKMGGFRDDPDAPSVFALEDFDPATQTATKAAVFTRRVLAPRPTRHGVDTADEAIVVCLDQLGRVDLGRIADLLGVDEIAARAQLGEQVYDDPMSGELVPAAAYLSGDVRAKHEAAVDAARNDERFGPNVAALAAVVPDDLTSDEIDVRPGQSWLPSEVMTGFVREVLGADHANTVYDPETATWELSVPAYMRESVMMTSQWGTGRRDAVALLQSACNNSPVVVYDELDDGRRVQNEEATLDAREKQDQLIGRFGAWVWEDPTRAIRLCEIYNRRFNSYVARTYDGAHLSLPGLADTFVPRPHQRAAVARILAEPAVLLAHDVGAGKTATMVIAAMELRRLGMANKPMVVVPNHMLEQFCTEWRTLYPTAKVLFPTESEQGPAGRKHFVGRAAVGDWDAVVVTQSVFERIPLSPATERSFIAEQVDALRSSSERVEASIGRRSRTVKDIEMRVLRLEERSKELLHRVGKDDGATFEQLGCDYLFVDEAHHAKNLAISTRMPGLGKTGSGLASQLDIRLRWLRRQYGQKVVTLATATPIANSLSEMWVIQHYARPDALTGAGVAHFDAWASNFAAQVTRLELAPEGTHYRVTTRLAKFRNVPDLLRMFLTFADVRGRADLALPVPAIRGGRPETVVVDDNVDLREFVVELGERAELIRARRVPPEEDNMLKVSSEGRAAALDLRLVGRPAPFTVTKLTVATERIAAIWRDNDARAYRSADGSEHPRPGGLQLVFADLGTPNGDRWNVFDELRGLLVGQGVPAESVRFVHEARNPREKEQLFAACRNGTVSVLIGTTARMGVGTNVQARCVALHHLDCPWRPADVEQREGRIIRQGNQNPDVEVLRYVTKGSFDVYMWQTVEIKAGFIQQVLGGRVEGRSVDDVASEQELSYAEVKALATGDDRIVRRAGLEAEVARMRRQRTAHFDEQRRLQRLVSTSRGKHDRLLVRIASLEPIVAGLTNTRGDAFSSDVEAHTYWERGPAGTHLLAISERALRSARLGHDTETDVAAIGGVAWRLRCAHQNPEQVVLTVAGSPAELVIDRDGFADIDPSRLVQRIEHATGKLPSTLDDMRAQVTYLAEKISSASGRLVDAFPAQDALDTASAELKTLTEALAADQPSRQSAAAVPSR